MPDLDLKPGDYRVQTKRGGWINRDDFRLIIPYVGVVGAGFLTFAWWNRDELPLVALMGTALVVGLFFGMALALWLKRFD